MPFKGLFNQNRQMEHSNHKNEIEKITLRINALEVHLKRLLNFENEFQRSMSRPVASSYKEKTLVNRKNNLNQRSSHEDSSKDTFEAGKFVNKKIEELSRRIDKLELYINENIPSIEERQLHSLKVEKQVRELVERILIQKFNEDRKKEEEWHDKIRRLEIQVSKILEGENDQTQVRQKGENSQLNLDSESCKQAPSEGILQNESIESFYFDTRQRLLLLEQNINLLNEGQVMLLRQVNELIGKSNDNQMADSEKEEQADPLLRTVYIDKLYLDKYEQNNNFAQLGIKSLSGALNIGATYGSVPMPIAEQVKEDIEKMKAAKEEMETQQKSESLSDHMGKESTSNSESPPSAHSTDETPFTEIQIEVDSLTEEESS
ncbi:hypothetical protein [Niallia oryzisoli]|uniref:hypothetical protein n=1 Tax=Niallia oryzisoli TaxID=1737571 RepID=UPI003735B5A8